MARAKMPFNVTVRHSNNVTSGVSVMLDQIGLYCVSETFMAESGKNFATALPSRLTIATSCHVHPSHAH